LVLLVTYGICLFLFFLFFFYWASFIRLLVQSNMSNYSRQICLSYCFSWHLLRLYFLFVFFNCCFVLLSIFYYPEWLLIWTRSTFSDDFIVQTKKKIDNLNFSIYSSVTILSILIFFFNKLLFINFHWDQYLLFLFAQQLFIL